MSDTSNEIIMYARERFCPDVARARRRLSDLGLAWTEYDIESDDDAKTRMMAITGRPNVPTLLIGDRVLIEPSEAAIDDALVATGVDVRALASMSDD
jgi:glutaredoxin